MSRFDDAARGFDAVHAQDPRGDAGIDYHRRVAAWVDRLAPEASEALRLAARAQHIGRWRIPRGSFPDGRAGYLKWRAEQGRAHAAEAAGILAGVGYDDGVVARVGDLLRKRRLRDDAEVQALEDAACLVFLETQLAGFAPTQDAGKLGDILRKTWAKMSEAGRSAALEVVGGLPESLRAVVEAALSDAPPPPR